MKNRLSPHSNIKNIEIESSLVLTKQKIKVSFVVKGVSEEYIFPNIESLKRADELWKATCFELLLADDSEAYYELNFSSSLSWNFYLLDSYRAEPKEVELLEEPMISCEYKNNEFHILFELESKEINFEKFKSYNIATILLTKEKERTFWAIEHLGNKPNFHNKESFKSL